MQKKLDRKELRHLYLCLNLMTIFNFNRYLRVFTTAVIFLFSRNILAKFTRNLITEELNIFKLSTAKM